MFNPISIIATIVIKANNAINNLGNVTDELVRTSAEFTKELEEAKAKDPKKPLFKNLSTSSDS